MIADRLNKLERALRRVAEQNDIDAEVHALFVRMWLASTPEVPKEQRDQAIESAQLRYERYLRQLSKVLAAGNKAAHGLLLESKPQSGDFDDRSER